MTTALDASRVVTPLRKIGLEPLAKPANRPYPLKYVRTWTMKNGTEVTIRPIRPEDEPLMVRFHQTLSDRSVYLRYFCSLSLSRRVAHERLVGICFGDYDREIVLVAERTEAGKGDCRIIAVGRMNRVRAGNEAEVAVLVSDQYQKLGLGHELLRRLVEIAQEEKLMRVSAQILPDNLAMQVIIEAPCFRVHLSKDLGSARAVLDL